MWTEERIKQLKDLWDQGLSAANIAKKIGNVTRNAVIGKANRLGLKARPSPIKKSKSSSPIESIIKHRDDIISQSISTCKWPVGDPKKDGFAFCGEETLPSIPYCAKHAKQAYQKFNVDAFLAGKSYKNVKKAS